MSTSQRPGVGSLLDRTFTVLGRAYVGMFIWVAASIVASLAISWGVNAIVAPAAFGDAADDFEQFAASWEGADPQGVAADGNLDPEEVSQLELEAIDFDALRNGLDALNMQAAINGLILAAIVAGVLGMIANAVFGVRAARAGLASVDDTADVAPVDGATTMRALSAYMRTQLVTAALVFVPLIIFGFGFSAAVGNAGESVAELGNAVVTDVEKMDDRQLERVISDLERGREPDDSVTFAATEKAWDEHDEEVGTAVGILALSALPLLALIVTVPLAVWLWVRWSLVLPVVAAEQIGGRAAVRRSAELVKGRWWTVFFIYLLMIISMAIISGIVSATFGGSNAVASAYGGAAPDVLGLVIQFITGAIGGLIAASISVGAYLGLREWKSADPMAAFSASPGIVPPPSPSADAASVGTYVPPSAHAHGALDTADAGESAGESEPSTDDGEDDATSPTQ